MRVVVSTHTARRFAVVRFGLRTGQLILKGLDQPFDRVVGELILESLTYTEGTYPATAVGFIAKNVFRQQDAAIDPQRHQRHRLLFMLLDGITTESNPADYR